MLGKTEVPALHWGAVIMATGKNVAIAGDTTRRLMVCRLESSLENPEDRQGFRYHPLLEWVRHERPRLVVAALTILRAWHVAGRPGGGCRTWGSFESWSSMVPPAIVFAGGADPMLTRPAALGEDDVEKRALVAIIDGLARLNGGSAGMSARSIIDALYPSERLRGHAPPDGFDATRDAIDATTSSPPGKAPTAVRLGSLLRRFKRRVAGGRMLDCTTDRTGTARWTVKGQAPAAGDAGLAGHVSTPRVETASDNDRSGDQNIPSNPTHPQQDDLYDRAEHEAVEGG